MRNSIFRIASQDTVKAYVYSMDGRLLAQVYDSGFTAIDQVKNALNRKVIGLPRKVEYTICNEDKGTYWTNRK